MDVLLRELATVSAFQAPGSNASSEPLQFDNQTVEELLRHLLAMVSKSELTRTLQRQQQELALLRGRLSEAESRLQRELDCRGQAAVKEAELRGQVSALQVQLNTAEGELARALKQAEWAGAELDCQLNELAVFRRQKAGEIIRLQSLKDASEAEVAALSQRASALESRCRDAEQRTETARVEAMKLKAEQQENLLLFAQEMDGRGRLIEVHKEAAEEALRRVEALEASLDEASSRAIDSNAQLAAMENRHACELAERDRLRAELEEQAASLRLALDQALRSTSLASGAETPIFAATEALKEFEASGQSFTEFYAESVQLRARLVRAEDELRRLKAHLTEIVKEVETKAPLLEQAHEERSRLNAELAAVRKDFLEILTARDSLLVKLGRVESDLVQTQAGKASAEQESRDLSQQLQRLLYEMELNAAGDASQGFGKRSRFGVHESANSAVLTAQEVISTNFVEFGSIAELQQRNQELLKAMRSLSAKLEAAETKGPAGLQSAASRVAELESQLKVMQETREKQAALLQAIMDNQDLLKTPKSAGAALENGKLEAELTRIKQELDQSRHANDRWESELASVRDKLMESQRDALAFQVQASKFEAQVSILNDRLSVSEATRDDAARDVARLRSQLQEQSANLIHAQTQLQQLMSDLMTAKDVESRNSTQIATLRAEVSAFAGEKKRVEGDLAQASAERERLQALLGQLQEMFGEKERAGSSVIEGFKRQIEILERDAASLRAQLAETLAQASVSATQTGREQRELLQRLDAAGEAIAKARADEERVRLELAQERAKVAEIEALLQRAAMEQAEGSETVQQELHVAQLRTRALLVDKERLAVRIQELEGQVAEDQSRFEAAQTAALAAQERLEAGISDLEGQLASAASSLSSVSGELEWARNELAHKANLEAELASAHEVLNQTRLDLQKAEIASASLETTRTELENVRQHLAEASSQIRELEGRLRADEARTVSLQEQNQKLLDSIESSGAGAEDSEIIRYLRQDRDSVADQLEALKSERARLELRCAQLEGQCSRLQEATQQNEAGSLEELEQTRAALTQKTQETEQLKIKTRLLQEQLTTARANASGTAANFEELSNLHAELSAAKAQLAVISEDAQNWKDQFELTQRRLAEEKTGREGELRQVRLQCDALRTRALSLNQSLNEAKAYIQELESAKQHSASVEVIEPSIENLQSPADDVSMAVEEAAEPEVEPFAMPNLVKTPEISEADSEIMSDSDEIYEEEGEEPDEHEHDSDEEELGEQSESVNAEVVPQAIALSPSTLTSTAAFTPIPTAPPPMARKVVNLSGIVSSSAVSSGAGSAAPATMITTASGKKFTPITAPEPKKSVISAANPSQQASGVQISGDEPASAGPKKKKKKKAAGESPKKMPANRMKK